MNYKVKFIIIVLIIMLSSCDSNKKNYTESIVNRVKYINNKLDINEENIEVTSSLILDFGKYDDLLPISDFKFHNRNNYFILNTNKSQIYEFNLKGNLINTFGNKGNGPGEFIYGFNLCVFDSLLIVPDARNMRLVKFKTSGEFRKFKEISYRYFPATLNKIEDGFLGSSNKNFSKENKDYSKFELKLLTNDFKPKKEFISIEKAIDYTSSFNSEDYNFYFTNSKKNIYFARNSDFEYEIEKYDYKGTLLTVFKRAYIKQQISKNHQNILKIQGERNSVKYNTKYKKAIYGLYFDMVKNRIWVKTNIYDHNFFCHFDIYENEILIKRVKLKLFEDFKILSIKDNTLYVQSQNGIIACVPIF